MLYFSAGCCCLSRRIFRQDGEEGNNQIKPVRWEKYVDGQKKADGNGIRKRGRKKEDRTVPACFRSAGSGGFCLQFISMEEFVLWGAVCL